MILLTGGTGYIGSHTAIALIHKGFEVVLVDNLSNSSQVVAEKIEQITGKKVKFYKADVLDKDAMREIFTQNNIKCVIHFAGLKSVKQSVQDPKLYYKNNVQGTAKLLEVMEGAGVRKIIFSSSATVYGVPKSPAIDESCKLNPVNPYGQSKVLVEELLRDLYNKEKTWQIAILRYFNPLGAHKSGLIGDNPDGIPNNLAPYICKVIEGKLKFVEVFGDDYNTVDGTGVRDYIHVMDLASGHLRAMDKLADFKCQAINLGTGRGYSVLEVIHTFEKALEAKIPYKISARRDGDIDEYYAKVDLAEKFLNWRAKWKIEHMAKDQLRVVLNNMKNQSKI